MRILLLMALLVLPGFADAADPVRIGQATTSLSFLPIWAARALDSFAAENISMQWAAIPGGDPTTLAALDSGDIDLAAVGSETALAAISKGQNFIFVASLMSRMSMDLVASPAMMKRAGVTAKDPLPQRLAALRGAVVGVSAVGGAQDRAVRWLAGRGGLDPARDIKVAMVGGPPALQAALENNRIDAFILSPPEAQLAEAAGSGRALVSLGADFQSLSSLPFLVLVAKTPIDAAAEDRLVRTLRALQSASAATRADPAGVAAAIGSKYFPKLDPAAVLAAVQSMQDGIAGNGRFSAAQIDTLLHFTAELDGKPSTLDGAGSEGKLWTDRYVDAAQARK